jgi:hypothetical protein
LNSFNAILNSEDSARLRFACNAVAPEVRNHLAALDRWVEIVSKDAQLAGDGGRCNTAA